MNTQLKNKKLRNHGQAYRSYRGKGREIPEKKQGPDCNCKQKCFEITSTEQRSNIFKTFWEMESRNLQNSYLFGCIKCTKVKRKTKKDLPSRRNFTVEYSVVISGERKKICKKAFLNIHGLQNNRGTIENIVVNITKGCSTPLMDKRGCHKNHKRKYKEEQFDHSLKNCQSTKVTIPGMTTKIVCL